MKPRTLDELLEHLPGLRRLRRLNAPMLRVLLDRHKGECTWCGGLVGKGRSMWCGDGCVKAFKMRCCPQTARQFVEKRDGGICQQCGRDTVAAEKKFAAVRHTEYPPPYRPGEPPSVAQERRRNREAAMRQYGWGRGQWREVDHNPPVAEYGGLCMVEQLRLLCGACHEAETTALAARRAGTCNVSST